MIAWLNDNMGTLVTIGSLVLNLLGGLGIVKPIRKPPVADDRS
jgi:hypothetical protein